MARPAVIRAGIAPQQVGHGEAVVRLLSALAIVSRHWRHRGGGLEGIMAVAEAGPGAAWTTRPVLVGPRDAPMRAARTCYDHLAGRLAVAMAADRTRGSGAGS